MKPLVSVIVPIYNVKKYLRKCIDSLQQQTLKNIEVILVDDGSTDGSGKIAEKYETEIDQNSIVPVFRCFHTKNLGLSAARNRGIEEAKSDLLMFVDGDDWVSENFCKCAYYVSQKYGADLVIFGFNTSKVSNRFKKEKKTITRIVNRETALKYGDNFAWNKLYRKELFDQIRFPEGKVYEDLAVIHRIVFKAGTIVMIPDILYHQLIRRDSISQCYSAENKREGFYFALRRARDLRSLNCREDVYIPIVISYALSFLTRSYPCEDYLYHKAENIIDHISYIPKDLTWQKKIMLMIWKADKGLFHIICSVFGQKDKQSRYNYINSK